METNTRKSFILHFDSLDVLDKLDNNTIAELFIACRDYNKGEDVKLSGIADIVFSQFKVQFDRDMEKYTNVVERNKINGLKGGRPKTQDNPDNPSGYSVNPKVPRKADSDSDSDNKNDKEENLFEEFWKEYPKKVDKKKAEIKYIAALSLTDHGKLVSAAKEYSKQSHNTESKFIKNPSNWLDNESWSEYTDDGEGAIEKLKLTNRYDTMVEGIKSRQWE